MTTFDHSVSVGDDRRFEKMIFPVTEEAEFKSESMWTELLPDGSYQVKNIPAWASGLALEDVVDGRRRGGELWFRRIRQQGGHSTYRIAFQDPDGLKIPQPDFERLRAEGCRFEHFSKRLVAMDIPAEVDADLIYRLLEEGMAKGIWWFDELHCGHPVAGKGSP
jgi:hypothetical protein